MQTCLWRSLQCEQVLLPPPKFLFPAPSPGLYLVSLPSLGTWKVWALHSPRPCLLKTCLIKMAQHPPLYLPHTLGASCDEIAPSSALPSVPYHLCLDTLPLPRAKSLGHATSSLCPIVVISWLLGLVGEQGIGVLTLAGECAGQVNE